MFLEYLICYNYKSVRKFINRGLTGKTDLIPESLKRVNAVIENNKNLFDIEPITFIEIEKYYKEDKFIWQLFLAIR